MGRSTTWRAPVLVATAVVGGCGGAAASSPGRDAAVESALEAAPPASCPDSPPLAGAMCGTERLTCEYGSDPSAQCDTLMRCTSGAWESIGGGSPCSTLNPAGCPGDASATINGGTCSLQVDCAIGRCSCYSDCAGAPGDCADAASVWHCQLNRPRLGASCSDAQGEWTSYACGPTEACAGGIWASAPAMCGRD